MQDHIEQLSSSASSVAAVSKAALGAAGVAAGEVAKGGGGWMLTYFVLGINTVQLCQLISAFFMLISIYKFFAEQKKSRIKSIPKTSKPVLSVNGGHDKPDPR